MNKPQSSINYFFIWYDKVKKKSLFSYLAILFIYFFFLQKIAVLLRLWRHYESQIHPNIIPWHDYTKRKVMRNRRKFFYRKSDQRKVFRDRLLNILKKIKIIISFVEPLTFNQATQNVTSFCFLQFSNKFFLSTRFIGLEGYHEESNLFSLCGNTHILLHNECRVIQCFLCIAVSSPLCWKWTHLMISSFSSSL